MIFHFRSGGFHAVATAGGVPLGLIFWMLIFLNAGAPIRSAAEAPGAAHRVRIVLVGDSTMTEKAGWGLGFKAYVTESAEYLNASAGGRSSQSFMTEGRWTNALALRGDYYLIQFGHNNEPGKPGRSTDMPTFFRNLEQYVDEARAIGAKPVLITPLTRRLWDKTDDRKIKSSLTPYAEAVERIAAAKNVPVLDLHSRSIELCEQLGREACEAFSPMKVVAGTNALDNTHLNAEGSFRFAELVVCEIRKAVPDLAQHLRTNVTPATASNATVAADQTRADRRETKTVSRSRATAAAEPVR